MLSEEFNNSIHERLKNYYYIFRPIVADLVNKKGLIKKSFFKEEDINDLLQDSILVLYEKLNDPTFQLTVKDSTYFYRIVENKIFEKLRKGKKHNIVDFEDIPDVEDNQYDAESERINNVKLKLIKECMKQLSKFQYRVLELFFFHSLSMKQIAVILDSSENSMKSQNKKAKDRIKECVETKISAYE
jgi:RNA polymerase sigma factor (sigma-70 family)